MSSPAGAANGSQPHPSDGPGGWLHPFLRKCGLQLSLSPLVAFQRGPTPLPLPMASTPATASADIAVAAQGRCASGRGRLGAPSFRDRSDRTKDVLGPIYRPAVS